MGELEEAEVMFPEEAKCALALLLDVSGSMDGEVEGRKKINELNRGVKVLKEELVNDELARKRVEIAVITFGGAEEVRAQGFSPVEEFNPGEFEAGGVTPMGKAILEGISQMESRKEYYKKNGIEYYRPWIWLVTDGEPTDMDVGDERWNRVVEAVREGEKSHKFSFWPVGVGGANIEKLKKVAPPDRVPLKLKGAMFKEMFLWLSRSMKKISVSKPGEQVELEKPGWGKLET